MWSRVSDHDWQATIHQHRGWRAPIGSLDQVEGAAFMFFVQAFAEGGCRSDMFQSGNFAHQAAKARDAARTPNDFYAFVVCTHGVVAVHCENADIHAMPGKTVGNLAGDAAFRGRNRWVFPGQQRDFEWGAFFRPLNRRDWVGIVHLSHATSTPHDVNGCIHVSRW